MSRKNKHETAIEAEIEANEKKLEEVNQRIADLHRTLDTLNAKNEVLEEVLRKVATDVTSGGEVID